MIDSITAFFAMLSLVFTDPLTLINEGKTYVILFPAYVMLLGGERIYHALTREEKWDNWDSASNLFMTGLMLVRDITLGVVLPLGAMALIYEHFRLFSLPQVWWGWLIALVIWDFFWYVDHWLGHRTGLFWSLHQVHHSSEEFNMTVSSRGFIFEFLSRPTFFLMPLVGISPTMFVTLKIFTSIWGIAQHTRLVPRIPVLDRFMATPSNHRVHHGSDQIYIDKNYGEITMVWDHLFGTYQAEIDEPKYGLTKNIGTYHPVKIQLSGLTWLKAQMATAPRFVDKVKYLYKPPGWVHDDSLLDVSMENHPST